MQYENIKISQTAKSIYLYLKQNGFSENYISNLRKVWGYIKVNGEIVNIKHSLKIGDKLEICNNPNTKTSIMQCILPLDIVYEDEYFLIVNKPANLATMPTRAHYDNNLAGAICGYMEAKDDNFVLRIVNRLDKDTSGLILVAKSSVAMKRLTNIEKTYYAICEGIIEKPLLVNSNIETLSQNGIITHRREISTSGKPAKTYVTPIKNLEHFTLIKLSLEHGRTHQIRVHLSSIGHPLFGDEVYGSKSDLISHTALVCKELSFYHPYLEKELEFQVPFPQDFEKLV